MSKNSIAYKVLPNVYQNGRDGFGHQMEGLIRLVSLHINNKIFYNYDFKTFEFLIYYGL